MLRYRSIPQQCSVRASQFMLVELPTQSEGFTRWQRPSVCLSVRLLVRRMRAAGAYRVNHSSRIELFYYCEIHFRVVFVV